MIQFLKETKNRKRLDIVDILQYLLRATMELTLEVRISVIEKPEENFIKIKYSINSKLVGWKARVLYRQVKFSSNPTYQVSHSSLSRD